ncbi:MAG: alpha/beta fold hydrolase [Pseudomonadota bacterium]
MTAVALNALRQGDGPSVLIAHGLFGSARNWGAIAKRLSSDFTVTTVDMRNHGESPRADTNGYEDMAADLNALGGQGHVIGHSMGGKAAMMLALTHPERVNRLIVADIAPVTYTHTQTPLIDAMRAVDLSRVQSRGDADRQLAEAVPEDAVRAFLLQSLDVKAQGWRLNLDVLAAEMDRIIGFPDISEHRFEGPALFLSGAESDYVQPEHRARIRTLFPNARFAKVTSAGHWLHAEKPKEFEASVRAFLQDEPPRGGVGAR